MAMCEEVKDFPVMGGDGKDLTLGDLFAWSSKEYISKASLEEKVFETWYDGRTVLLGDGKLRRTTIPAIDGHVQEHKYSLTNYLVTSPLFPNSMPQGRFGSSFKRTDSYVDSQPAPIYLLTGFPCLNLVHL